MWRHAETIGAVLLALALLACRQPAASPAPASPAPTAFQSTEPSTVGERLALMRQVMASAPAGELPLDGAAALLHYASLLFRQLAERPAGLSAEDQQAVAELATMLGRLPPSVEQARAISPTHKQQLRDAIGAVEQTAKQVAETANRVPPAQRHESLERLAHVVDRLAVIVVHPEREGEAFQLRVRQLIAELDQIRQELQQFAK